MQIKLVQSHEDLLRCFPVIHELRPHLTVERFVEMYEQMQKESYQIAFVEEPKSGNLVSRRIPMYESVLRWQNYLYRRPQYIAPSSWERSG